MSRCPICDCKPMNCDCSEEARQLYYLRQEMEEKDDHVGATPEAINQVADAIKRLENGLVSVMTVDQAKQAERRDLFKSVALRTVADYGNNEGVVWCPIATKVITEEILEAADKFSKERYL